MTIAKKKMPPKISIIVPVYNTEEYLVQCLESIRNQTLDEIEVLMINDCSKDDSYKIIESFAKSDSRFLSFKNSKNIGLGATRNYGISKAKGKYLLFVDSDDWIDSNTCEILFSIAERNSLEVLIGNYSIVYNRNISLNSKVDLDKKVDCISGKELLTKNEIFTAVWDKLWLRDFVTSNNLQNDTEHYYEDIPFTVNGIISSKNCSKIDYPFYYYYRGNLNSITNHASTDKHLNDRRWAIIYLTGILTKHKNSEIERPLQILLAKQIQPALANLRSYKGINRQSKSMLLKSIRETVTKTRTVIFTMRTIPVIKRVIIILIPSLYNTLLNLKNIVQRQSFVSIKK